MTRDLFVEVARGGHVSEHEPTDKFSMADDNDAQIADKRQNQSEDNKSQSEGRRNL